MVRILALMAAPYLSAVALVLFQSRPPVAVKIIPAVGETHPCRGSHVTCRLRGGRTSLPIGSGSRRGWRKVEAEGICIEGNVSSNDLQLAFRAIQAAARGCEEWLGVRLPEVKALLCARPCDVPGGNPGGEALRIELAPPRLVVLRQSPTKMAAQLIHGTVHLALERRIRTRFWDEGLAEWLAGGTLTEVGLDPGGGAAAVIGEVLELDRLDRLPNLRLLAEEFEDASPQRAVAAFAASAVARSLGREGIRALRMGSLPLSRVDSLLRDRIEEFRRGSAGRKR